MNIYKTVALFVILVAASIYVYKVDYAAKIADEESKKAGEKIFDFEAADVVKISIKGKEEIEIILQDGKWEIVSPLHVPADEEAVHKIIRAAAEHEVVEMIGEVESLKEYGLEEPELTVDFYLKDRPEPATLWMGGQTPNRHTTYARTTKLKGVALARNSLKDFADKNLYGLRRKRVIEGELYQVDRAEVRHGENRFMLQRVGHANWLIVEPESAVADKIEADYLIQRIITVQAKEYFDEPVDEIESGFDDPTATVKVWFNGSEEPLTLLFGKSDARKDGIWLKWKEGGTVALIRKDFWESAALTVGAMRDKKIFPPGGEELQRRVVKLRWKQLGKKGKAEFNLGAGIGINLPAGPKDDGKTMEIVRGKSGEWEMTIPEKKEIDQSRVTEFIRDLSSAEAGRLTDESSLSGAKPVIGFELVLEDGIRRVTFYGWESGKVVWFGKGGPFDSPFTADAKLFGLFDKSAEDFVDHHVFKMKIEEVGSVALKRKGLDMKAVYGRGEWRISEPEDMFADPRKINALIGYMTDMEYIERVEGTGKETENPLATLKLESRDGKRKYELLLLRYNKDETLLVAKLEGDDLTLLLNSQILKEGLPGKLKDLLP